LAPERQARIHALAREGLSHSAIARITGLHRVTVSRWLKAAPVETPTSVPVRDDALACEDAAPDENTLKAMLAAEAVPTDAPPAPWTSWAQVWQVRETLKEHRGLLLRRADHLSEEQQDTINLLVDGPLADVVGVARRFLLDWYALWCTDDGQRRPLVEAQERYERWRANPDYRALPPLRKVQDLMTPERFTRLSQFLRTPHWEATNNGAERAGRAFRHGQAPHYRLRTPTAIDGALRVVASQTKERAVAPPAPIIRLCPRGRRARLAGAQAA
jgi:hypothetical protein